MKSFLGSLAVAVLVAGSVFAGGTQKIQGHLVDVACASENAAKPKPGFAAKHSKDCLEMAECAASGYAIVTPDNKVIKLDAKGNETAKELIAGSKKSADFKASASGTLDGDTLAVESLTLE
jgi:hypothetical protein